MGWNAEGSAATKWAVCVIKPTRCTNLSNLFLE
jgi:hypothetical protein